MAVFLENNHFRYFLLYFSLEMRPRLPTFPIFPLLNLFFLAWNKFLLLTCLSFPSSCSSFWTPSRIQIQSTIYPSLPITPSPLLRPRETRQVSCLSLVTWLLLLSFYLFYLTYEHPDQCSPAPALLLTRHNVARRATSERTTPPLAGSQYIVVSCYTVSGGKGVSGVDVLGQLFFGTQIPLATLFRHF